jgi:hypothetical protein
MKPYRRRVPEDVLTLLPRSLLSKISINLAGQLLSSETFAFQRDLDIMASRKRSSRQQTAEITIFMFLKSKWSFNAGKSYSLIM